MNRLKPGIFALEIEIFSNVRSENEDCSAAITVCRKPGARLRPSHRPLPLHRHPRAGAGVRPVVPPRAVLGAAVVPEGDGGLAPAEAALEQRIFRVLVEIV